MFWNKNTKRENWIKTKNSFLSYNFYMFFHLFLTSSFFTFAILVIFKTSNTLKKQITSFGYFDLYKTKHITNSIHWQKNCFYS